MVLSENSSGSNEGTHDNIRSTARYAPLRSTSPSRYSAASDMIVLGGTGIVDEADSSAAVKSERKMIASKNLEGGSHGLFKYVIHYYATICFR